MREDYKKQMDKYKVKDEEKRKRLAEKKKTQKVTTPTNLHNKNIKAEKDKKNINQKSGFLVMVEAIWTLIQFIPIILIGIFALVIIGGLIFMFLKSLFS